MLRVGTSARFPNSPGRGDRSVGPDALAGFIRPEGTTPCPFKGQQLDIKDAISSTFFWKPNPNLISSHVPHRHLAGVIFFRDDGIQPFGVLFNRAGKPHFRPSLVHVGEVFYRPNDILVWKILFRTGTLYRLCAIELRLPIFRKEAVRHHGILNGVNLAV